MQGAMHQLAIAMITLLGLSFSCSPAGQKRSIGPAFDSQNQNTATTETLEKEPADPTGESVSPPANISGSYLICAEAKAATAETPEAIINCGLRDKLNNSKIDISTYPVQTWTYKVAEANSITVSKADLTTSLEWHVAITLKAPSLGEIQNAQKSVKFLLTVTDAAAQKFQERSKSATQSCWDLKVSGNDIDGIYTIYPDGSAVSAYCDMTNNGGGWTLLAASPYGYDADNGNPALPIVTTLTNPNGTGILSASIVSNIANEASNIRINNGSPSSLNYVLSTDSATLTKLRNYQTLNVSTMAGVAPNSAWSGSAGNENKMNFTCPGAYTEALSTTIYHGCGYIGPNGTDYPSLHWLPSIPRTRWQWYPGDYADLTLWSK